MNTRMAIRVVLLSMVEMTAALAADSYKAPTADAFLASIKSYPFAASAARREKLRVGVPQLTRCMSVPEVRKLIGDPEFGYATNKGGVGAMNWSYVLEKKELKEKEPSARVVIWFDPKGKLQGVTVHGALDIEHTVSRRDTTPCP